MAVPLNPIFDRYAQMSYGLVAIGYGPEVQANYLALVTGFMYGDNWALCYDMPVTSWSLCAAAPTTSWSAFTAPSTTWSLVPTIF